MRAGARQVRAEVTITDGGASEDVVRVLRLLRAVFLISRDWYAVAAPLSESSEVPLESRAPLVPAADFVNVKLASKLMRQLQVPPRPSSLLLPPPPRQDPLATCLSEASGPAHPAAVRRTALARSLRGGPGAGMRLQTQRARAASAPRDKARPAARRSLL